MSGPVKDDSIAKAIVTARIARPDLVPFASGVSSTDNRGDYLNASEAGRCARHSGTNAAARRARLNPPRRSAVTLPRPGLPLLGAAKIGVALRLRSPPPGRRPNRIAAPYGLLVDRSESVVEVVIRLDNDAAFAVDG